MSRHTDTPSRCLRCRALHLTRDSRGHRVQVCAACQRRNAEEVRLRQAREEDAVLSLSEARRRELFQSLADLVKAKRWPA